MANELLKRYLVERLTDLNPALSDTPGSPMYAKVIDPLIARLGIDPMGTNIEDFVVARMKDDPQTAALDVESAGSFFRDTLAKPLMLLLEPLQREIAYIRQQQSVAAGDALASEELDAIMANMFEYRNAGDVTRGSVRVFYSAPQAVSVDAGVVFTSRLGLQFIPSYPQTKSAADFVRAGDQYYVDFDIQSVIAHEGANVDADDIKFVTGLPNVVLVTNPLKLSGGVTEETNQQFMLRAEQSLSEKSLNSPRAIQKVLKNNFANLASIDVIGYGDARMQRDVLTGTVSVDQPNTPGSVLVTRVLTSAYPLTATVPDPVSSLTAWTPGSFVPMTNVVEVVTGSYSAYAAVYDKIKNAQYIRLNSLTDADDEATLGRVRSVKAIESVTSGDIVVPEHDITARSVRVVLDDFEILAAGSTGATTVPHDNAYSDQGASFKLRTVDNVWRAAPLPFTDIITVNNSLSTYTPVDGLDYLVVRGTDVAGAFRAYPIRAKPAANTLAIHRVDQAMVSQRLAGSLQTYTNNKSVCLVSEPPEVLCFGAPDLGDPAHAADATTGMFDGLSTVSGGVAKRGGVNIKQNNSEYGTAFVVLAPDASRPNGWRSLGVEVGDFISLAGFVTDSTSFDGTQGFDFWQYARITDVGTGALSGTLTVKGLDLASARSNNLLGYAFTGGIWQFPPTNGACYRLHWTVYRGQLETILPNNNQHISYDDFAFAPAYKTTGISSGLWEVADKYIPTIGAKADITALNNTVVSNPIRAYGASTNRMAWAIVRTQKDFMTDKDESGKLFVESGLGVEVVYTHADLRTLGRYSTDAADWFHDNYYLAVSSPIPAFRAMVADIGGAPVQNTKLLEYILYPEADASDKVLQGIDASVTVTADPVLTVSGIPGSYPFNDQFGAPIVVKSNEVHLGGCTDVHVKATSVDAATASFQLTTDRVDTTDDPLGTVVHYGSDGYVMPDALQYFYCPSIHVLSDEQAGRVVNATVEILRSTEPTLVGKVFRIVELDLDNSRIRLDGAFSAIGLTVGITFRIAVAAVVDLAKPKTVLQTGTDLRIPLEESNVYATSGFAFDLSTLSGLYLEIQSGSNVGVYPITGATTSRVTVQGSLLGIETNIKYSIYRIQSGIGLPLVRIRSLELASADDVGVPIPYRLPVDIT